MGQMTCEVKKARWARILDALRLSRPQQDALLLLRKQHLKKLHDVYEQRQRLNMQVCSPSGCWVQPPVSTHEVMLCTDGSIKRPVCHRLLLAVWCMVLICAHASNPALPSGDAEASPV